MIKFRFIYYFYYFLIHYLKQEEGRLKFKAKIFKSLIKSQPFKNGKKEGLKGNQSPRKSSNQSSRSFDPPDASAIFSGVFVGFFGLSDS